MRGGASGHGPSRPFRARRTARERTPSARRRSAITTRPQPCRESNTCSHKAGGSGRHGRRGAFDATLGRSNWDGSYRSVASHLATADSEACEPGRKSCELDRRCCSPNRRRQHASRAGVPDKRVVSPKGTVSPNVERLTAVPMVPRRCAGVSYYGCSRGSGVGSPHANNALAAA